MGSMGHCSAALLAFISCGHTHGCEIHLDAAPLLEMWKPAPPSSSFTENQGVCGKAEIQAQFLLYSVTDHFLLQVSALSQRFGSY